MCLETDFTYTLYGFYELKCLKPDLYIHHIRHINKTTLSYRLIYCIIIFFKYTIKTCRMRYPHCGLHFKKLLLI